ncbi:hypothetical protein [Paenibacillus wenxiniae]|uniref:Uncharacterized protein n=1 Tax=Paenibacillus wenxiniae TaxID=1636843 RepID=A0ABW4RG21_9BACL
MANINWNNGQLITLGVGDTATSNGSLNWGQLYALIFYNSASANTSTNVTVVAGSLPPKIVTVPGTTAQQGLASVVFFNGSDSNTISASILQGETGSQIQAFIASVKMPLDTTGINNVSLQADGQYHAFNKFTRYYTVPASHWYQGTLKSNINQFISIQFKESSAIVNVLNAPDGTTVHVDGLGIAATQNQFKIYTTPASTYSWSVRGDGTQYVWVNADSAQDSQDAAISLQSLSALY